MRRSNLVLAQRAIESMLRSVNARNNPGFRNDVAANWTLLQRSLSTGGDSGDRQRREPSARGTDSPVLSSMAALRSQLSAAGSAVAQSSYGRLMRLDKPIGTHLLFLPTAWGISIAATSVGDAASLCALTYGGAVIMRGAGCTMNDLWDQDIDGEVERTRARPLAAGEISVPAAFVFLGAQLSAGLAVLLSLSNYAICVGAPSVVPVLLYPLAKRMTDYPQAVLGLTINWGALVGYAAAADALGAPALCLYGAGWCWTMIYDTIYAHQDKRDDARIGVRSSALALEGRTKPALALLAVGKIGLLAGAGVCADLSAPYFVGVTLAGVHVAWQIVATDLASPEDCMKTFVSNTTTGAITWAAIVAGRLF
jgi:4-hydroxybenzoate polyprenyl transferase